MAKSVRYPGIPTELSLEQFGQFVLPHLTVESRGPAPKLSLHALFNYILKLLYLGCQWKELPIAKDFEGRPEVHYTRVYGAFRRGQAGGCFDLIFSAMVLSVCLWTSGAEFLDDEALEAARKDRDERDRNESDEVLFERSKMVFNRR